MGLSCECNTDDYDYGDGWYWMKPGGYTELKTTRRKRCCSCQKLIDLNSTVIEFERFRSTHTEIEERIWGDGIPLCYWYMCECCSDLFFSLDELGYCISLGDSMKELVKEYQEIKKTN